MARTRGATIAAGAIWALALGATATVARPDGEALCGGRRYEMISAPKDSRPFVELSADGVSGRFLLDYGATRSSLSAEAFHGAEGAVRKATLSLPSFEGGEFDLLPRLIETGLIRNCQNVQVQFHAWVPNAVEKRLQIRRSLLQTHAITYDYPFVWENWRVRS